MDNPRPEKVAVVDEVRSRLSDSSGAILTEYRGLTVSEMAELRRTLERAGGEYKVYKNTLVKLATVGTGHEGLHSLLVGPTAIAFVNGEISAVAKALRDYARTNPNLVVKGGMFGDEVLSTSELSTLADLPSRDVLLARLAGAIAAPLQQMAGLLQALPRNLAYGLSALIKERPAEPGAPADAAPVAAPELQGESADAETNTSTEAATAPPDKAEAGEAQAGIADDEVVTGQVPTESDAPGEAAEQAPDPETASTETASTETAGTETAGTETAGTENDETSETKEQSDNG